MEEWQNLEVDSSFCQRLYDAAKQCIGFENLSFYHD